MTTRQINKSGWTIYYRERTKLLGMAELRYYSKLICRLLVVVLVYVCVCACVCVCVLLLLFLFYKSRSVSVMLHTHTHTHTSYHPILAKAVKFSTDALKQGAHTCLVLITPSRLLKTVSRRPQKRQHAASVSDRRI